MAKQAREAYRLESIQKKHEDDRDKFQELVTSQDEQIYRLESKFTQLFAQWKNATKEVNDLQTQFNVAREEKMATVRDLSKQALKNKMYPSLK